MKFVIGILILLIPIVVFVACLWWKGRQWDRDWLDELRQESEEYDE